MITTNVYFRVFHLKAGGKSGTCFSLDVNGKQYIVCAKHQVEYWDFSNCMEIFHEELWKEVKFDLVGHCEDPIDISVLAPFLGFPYGLSGEMGKINRGFPLPLIKKL